MKIDVLTLFPEMFDSLKSSMIGRALQNGVFELRIADIRSYSTDKHQKCDDTPYGGGAGMVMTPQPIADAIKALDPDHTARRIYLSPKGRTLCQDIVEEYAKTDHLLLLCGHYEGVDQRIIDFYMDEELSIGDYCLTGGELAAQVVIDSVARYIPGVLGNESTTADESFANGLLEYPQYTRPPVFEGHGVPEILLSGHHAKVAAWRKEESMRITKERRRDLLDNKK